jgi:hypothetical protein
MFSQYQLNSDGVSTFSSCGRATNDIPPRRTSSTSFISHLHRGQCLHFVFTNDSAEIGQPAHLSEFIEMSAYILTKNLTIITFSIQGEDDPPFLQLFVVFSFPALFRKTAAGQNLVARPVQSPHTPGREQASGPFKLCVIPPSAPGSVSESESRARCRRPATQRSAGPVGRRRSLYRNGTVRTPGASGRLLYQAAGWENC